MTSTEDLPEGAPVVLFDGVCNLCSGLVRFAVPRDPGGRLRFAPLQSEAAEALLADHDLDVEVGSDADAEGGGMDTIVLVEDGSVYTKSTAVLRIAHHLGGVYGLLWAFRVVPKVVRDAVYDLVARYRYPIFGKKDRCMVPTPDVRSRFLEMTPMGEGDTEREPQEEASTGT